MTDANHIAAFGFIGLFSLNAGILQLAIGNFMRFNLIHQQLSLGITFQLCLTSTFIIQH